MNINEKRKKQFQFISAILIAVSVIIAVVGIVLLTTSGVSSASLILKLVFGIVLIILGLAGLIVGIVLSTIANSIKATNGSIAEEIVGKGTVNMHKCENCGAEVSADKKLCEKCEENLKP